MKRAQFLKHLHQHSCVLKREGSGHTIYMNIITGKKTSIPRHNEIENYLCNEICSQLEVPKIK